jgi:hypothetical protein
VFDVAEEYTELLYRQFLVLLGTPVFPLITLFAVVSFGVEYVAVALASRTALALVRGSGCGSMARS